MKNMFMRTINKSAIRLGVLAGVLALTVSAPGFAKADVVSDWNAIAVDTAVANGANPFAQGRYGAIVQLAVFEAVNSITQDYRPYIGITPRPGASPEAAAIEAAYHVLSVYFPNSASALNSDLASSLAQIPSSQAKTDGIAAGDEAATAIISLRTNDGASPPQFKVPGPAVPGEWQATKSCPTVNSVKVGTAYHWQNVTPFGVPDAKAFLLPPPPALTSEAYAKAYNEVMTVGDVNSTQRPQDRADVATFFAVSSPTQAFNQVAREVIQQQGRSLSANARALALMNMAINDSLVASFYNKYLYNF
ncbi:MAG TPA: hypothetical protein VJ728_13725, partial [Candidatus Binataceae bacterium]|nr:hypothetical protein [Candidatus Binataceae bacterium]